MKTRGCNIGSFLQTRSGVAAVLLSVAMAAVATPARADSISIGFEGPSYVVGSIDGQQGWGGQTPPGIAVDTNIDQGVSGSTPGHTGSQSYRESSFYTTGSFGNQVFSPSLTDRAGEASSAADGLAGGTLQQRFMSTVWFKPTVIVPQDSHVVYSADRGDGARMTWMQVSDNITAPGDGRLGLSVSFNDYKVPSGTEPACAGPDNAADGEGKCFVFHVLSTNLSRTDWHRIDMEIGFYDGAANDVVRASVDGVELYVGTTWEDYFRNQEGNPTRPVDSLLFRVGGTAEGISGQGFLFDDISYASGPCLASTRYVTTTGSDTFNDCRNIGSPCATVQHGVDVACVGDTVEVGAGTFTEQVAIPKSVTVHGTGAATTKIQAPAIMPAAPANSIVVVSGPSTTAAIKNLTVAGPGSTGCNSIRAGIDVRDSASASILDDAVVDIRDTPFGGCQNGIGILVGSVSLGYDGHAVIQNTTVSGHQKAGIVVVNSGSTATIQGNVITGVGPTPFIAENGIQVSDGAKASVTQNVISGHECNHATCGADPINDYQSAGILLIDAGTPTTVSGNTVSANDIGIYHYTTAVAATTITNNTVSGTRFEGVFIDQGTANVTNNKITGGNYGVLAVAFTGSTGNSTATLTCNQVQSTGVGIGLIDDDTIGDTNVPSITAHNNQIAGNTIGVKNTTAGVVNATGNYWGSGTGPNPPGSGDTLVGPVTGVPYLTTLPNCIACTTNGDCANGIGCDGAEVCNAGVCQPGTPVTCGPPTQCQISVGCQEPSGTCVPVPKADGVLCSDGQACTVNDTCQAGVCQAGAGADTDNDGYCDAEEIACGCNPNDGTEICSQPNRLVGLAGNGAGEVLLNWYTPTVRKVTMATDPSCATSGAGLCVGQKCVAGRILDRCTTDADCYLPVDTCRVVVNYGDTADAKLVYARFRKTDVPGFVIGTASPATPIPVAPGCSKKVNVLVPTPRRDNLKLKATGTIDAKPRKDVDIIQYRR